MQDLAGRTIKNKCEVCSNETKRKEKGRYICQDCNNMMVANEDIEKEIIDNFNNKGGVTDEQTIRKATVKKR